MLGGACTIGGLALWLAPGRPGRALGVFSVGVALAAFWRASGIDDAEGRLVERGSRVLFIFGDSTYGLIMAGLLGTIVLFGCFGCLAAAVCWTGEAISARAQGRGRRSVLLAASAAGAVAWFFTGLQFLGIPQGVWATDLPVQLGVLSWRPWIELTITALDMTGLAAAWAVTRPAAIL